MSTDYEPGTVAVATVRGVKGVRVVRVDHASTPEWMTVGVHPEGVIWHADVHVTDVRPLVVLDPADGALVIRDWCPSGAHREGLLDLLREHYWSNLADQIEAQTKPPGIPEPHGLGAVVEDSEHRLWIRHSNAPGSFPWVLEGVGARGWSEIEAVKVLSEGVVR